MSSAASSASKVFIVESHEPSLGWRSWCGSPRAHGETPWWMDDLRVSSRLPAADVSLSKRSQLFSSSSLPVSDPQALAAHAASSRAASEVLVAPCPLLGLAWTGRCMAGEMTSTPRLCWPTTLWWLAPGFEPFELRSWMKLFGADDECDGGRCGAAGDACTLEAGEPRGCDLAVSALASVVMCRRCTGADAEAEGGTSRADAGAEGNEEAEGDAEAEGSASGALAAGRAGTIRALPAYASVLSCGC
mmetsp:Transcript_20130/g.51247  ORF Transcript_20130/g.51247 Transcript_20130/m.51247 type:complete len:246 (-) Transcript_20130:853-1590(-)